MVSSGGRRSVKKVKPVKGRQLTATIDCFGELIQIDGAERAWFERKRVKCTLLVFIDDAISRLVNLIFIEAQTIQDSFASLKEYLLQHGKPMAV